LPPFWVDGAFRGIGMPKSATPEQRKRMGLGAK
jgi:hypothetical protein